MPGDTGSSDRDDQGTLCSFFEGGAIGLVFLVGAVGVEELGGAGAEDLEAVVEVGAGGEGLSAEAGAGVVDFEELNGLASMIADCGFDIRGVAAGGGEAGEKGEREQRTHKDQGYQGGWCVDPVCRRTMFCGGENNAKADPCGMTTKERATAKAKTTADPLRG